MSAVRMRFSKLGVGRERLEEVVLGEDVQLHLGARDDGPPDRAA